MSKKPQRGCTTDDSMDHLTPEELEALEAKALEACKKRSADWPTDEKGIEDWLNTMPLLASSRPADGEATGDFEVIEDLIKSTEPAERANNFKASGNAAYQMAQKGDKKRLKHALVYYTQGLDTGTTDRSVLAALYANRALVHYAMENYGHCIQDCMASISNIPTNVKPYYRAAQASLTLGKHKQALNFIQGGRKALKSHLLVEDESKMLDKLEAAVAKAQQDALEAEQKAQREATESKKKAAEKANKWKEACVQRAIVLKPPLLDLDGYDPPDPYLDTHGRLHWPVLFLYEQLMTTDFVRDFDEANTLQYQLTEMFPATKTSAQPFAPWDTEHVYYVSNLRVFVERKKGARVEVNLQSSLADVLNHKKPSFEVPRIPTFFVIPRTPK